MITIDANVFISSLRLTEIQSHDSELFLQVVGNQSINVKSPTLILAETVAGIVRSTGNVSLAKRGLQKIISFPGISLVNLTMTRARLAARLALDYRLRGADSVYVAVAQECGTTLITWDTEMLTRGVHAVPTMTPTDWLAANSAL